MLKSFMSPLKAERMYDDSIFSIFDSDRDSINYNISISNEEYKEKSLWFPTARPSGDKCIDNVIQKTYAGGRTRKAADKSKKKISSGGKRHVAPLYGQAAAPPAFNPAPKSPQSPWINPSQEEREAPEKIKNWLKNAKNKLSSLSSLNPFAAGGLKEKVSLVKKNVLGKQRNIYKFVGNKKKYIKYKNKYVLLKKYIEIHKKKSKAKKTKPKTKSKSKSKSKK